MATIQRITTELARMSMLYRQQMSHEELQAIALAWAELCHDLTDDAFIAACKAHLRESKFFPCPADILKAHEDALPNYPGPTALPEITNSPEEQHRSAINAAMCFMSLHNPEARQFFTLPDWDAKDAFARRMLGARYPEPGKSSARRGPVALGNVIDGMGIRQ